MSELKYLGLSTGVSDGHDPRLQFATPTGRVREASLTRAQLLEIIKSAASALEQLDRQGK